MNRSLLLVVCDFLLLSILALARFDVPEGAVIAQDDEKVVSKEVIERISDGENYDDYYSDEKILDSIKDSKVNKKGPTLRELLLKINNS